MLVCPSCSSEQPDSGTFCDQCGAALRPGVPQARSPAAPRADSPTTGVDAGLPAEPALCPQCGRPWIAGAAFCHMCGAPKPPPDAPAPTVDAPTTYIPDVSSLPPARERPKAGLVREGEPHDPSPPPASSKPDEPDAWEHESDTRDLPDLDFGPGIPGSLVVCESNTTICFPGGRTELVIGRRDPSGTFAPDIDLTEQGGAAKGVSRQHARIYCREAQVYIQDLGSNNGTYVNQHKLAARQEQALRNQDTIWLGHLEMVFAASKDPPD
jgi:hypothetical protein